MNIFSRLNRRLKTRKAGLLALCASFLVTVVGVGMIGESEKGPSPSGQGILAVHPSTGVQLRAALSQPKIVQWGDGRVYLDLSITSPQDTREPESAAASDLMIVLDRSSSMSGAKWEHATQAVRQLLDRLRPEDRIGLVTFADSAQKPFGLQAAKPENLARLRGLSYSLQPGGGTNLGAGLLAAERLLESAADRRQRVLLLSDGHANAGIIEPRELASIVRRMSDRGSVVSAIGLGLGFNEVLLATLADTGMGAFSFLEHPESLQAILDQELQDSRRVFADGSEIRLDLPQGVRLLDAAGYPFETQGSAAVIRTGRMLQGSAKRFILTLDVSNRDIAQYPLGELELAYRNQGRTFRQILPAGRLQIACVSAQREQDVQNSINEEVYREAWISNNLGSAMRKVSDLIRQGKKDEAMQSLDSFRDELQEAEQSAPGLRKQAAPILADVEQRVEESFRGADQILNRNRNAKELLGVSQSTQRKLEPKGQ